MSSFFITPFESNFSSPSSAELNTVGLSPASARCNSENKVDASLVFFVLTDVAADVVITFFVDEDFPAVAKMKSALAKVASTRMAGFFIRCIGERGFIGFSNGFYYQIKTVPDDETVLDFSDHKDTSY